MYMEPEFPKIRSIRNFYKCVYPPYVLKKKCRMCRVLNYHWLTIIGLSPRILRLINFDFEIHIGLSWLYTHELLVLVVARSYVT